MTCEKRGVRRKCVADYFSYGALVTCKPTQACGHPGGRAWFIEDGEIIIGKIVIETKPTKTLEKSLTSSE